MTLYDWEWVNAMVRKYGLRRPFCDVGGYPFLSVPRYKPHALMEPVGGACVRSFDHLDAGYEIISPDYGKPMELRVTAEDSVRLRPSAYGTVLCSGVIEHATDPFACVAALGLLIRRGGLILLGAPFMWQRHGDPGTDFWRFTVDGLQLAAERAGLNVLEAGWIYGDGQALKSMAGVVATVGAELGPADDVEWQAPELKERPPK